jgi:hypothetical protein
MPPYPLTRIALTWLDYLITEHHDADALRLLWWQVSIGPGGINEPKPSQYHTDAAQSPRGPGG